MSAEGIIHVPGLGITLNTGITDVARFRFEGRVGHLIRAVRDLDLPTEVQAAANLPLLHFP